MIKKIGIILLVLSILFLAGCNVENTTTKVESEYTEQTMQEMQRQVGNPEITNFYEKKLAKEIFELRDNSKLITYAYMVNLNGKFVYLGRCLGFGLPYSVQYTNPEKVAKSYSGRYVILPQADPNGLYMPDGLSATWLMLVNEKTGEPEIIYTEPNIVVTQNKLPRRLVADWSIPVGY